MNSELEKIRDEMLNAQDKRIISEYREKAEPLLDEALEFFKTNIDKEIFSTTLPVLNADFKFVLVVMAKEQKYQFDVRFSKILFWKVFIHIDECGFGGGNSISSIN